jgi:hypothetical protein
MAPNGVQSGGSADKEGLVRADLGLAARLQGTMRPNAGARNDLVDTKGVASEHQLLLAEQRWKQQLIDGRVAGWATARDWLRKRALL